MNTSADEQVQKLHEASEVRLFEIAGACFLGDSKPWRENDPDGHDRLFHFRRTLAPTTTCADPHRWVAIRVNLDEIEDHAQYGAAYAFRVEEALKSFITQQLALNQQHDAEWDFKEYFKKLRFSSDRFTTPS